MHNIKREVVNMTKRTKRSNGEGSIFRVKNKELYAVAVTIGRDDKTGKLVRKTVYAKTKADALKKRNEIQQKYKSVIMIAGDKITVADWVQQYLQIYKKQSVRQNTYESYLYIAEHYLLPDLQRVKLAKLNQAQVQAVINDIATTASARTAEYAFAILRMACRQAVNAGLIMIEPTRGIQKPKKEKKSITVVNANQVSALIANAYTDMLKIAVKILFATGIRASELCALTWDCFNSDSLRIENSVENGANGAKITPPKTKASKRTIKIPAKLVRDLRAYKKEQTTKILQSAENEYENNNLICARESGKPLMPRDFGRMFKRVAQRANLPTDITPHVLRHAHATELFRAGWNAKDVQERLGHSSIKVTIDTYTEYIPERQNDIADYINSIYPNS